MNKPNENCKNILVVDDEEAIRTILRDVLEIEGFKVFTAEDGGEGIDILNRLLPQPCIVILDLMMQKFNGWQFLDIQRNDPRLSQIPVIICSAYLESAKAVHAQGFIPKPIQLEPLLQAVKAHCA
jgi:CheY-like chemotaxis protein